MEKELWLLLGRFLHMVGKWLWVFLGSILHMSLLNSYLYDWKMALGPPGQFLLHVLIQFWHGGHKLWSLFKMVGKCPWDLLDSSLQTT